MFSPRLTINLYVCFEVIYIIHMSFFVVLDQENDETQQASEHFSAGVEQWIHLSRVMHTIAPGFVVKET